MLKPRFIFFAIAISLCILGCDKNNVSLLAVKADSAIVLDKVHAALDDTKINFIDESTKCIAISDFVSIIFTSFSDIKNRLCDVDPRRTILIDSLEKKFSVVDKNNLKWHVIYLFDANKTQKKIFTQKLNDENITWCANTISNTVSKKYSYILAKIIAIVWALFLIFKNIRSPKLLRLIFSLAWLPLLIAPTISSFIVFIIGITASIESLSLIRPSSKKSFFNALWPYAIFMFVVFVFSLVYNNINIISLSVSIFIFGVIILSYRHIDKFVFSLKLFGRRNPPKFLLLSTKPIEKHIRMMLIPAAIISVIFILIYWLTPSAVLNSSYIVECAKSLSSEDANKIYSEHIAYEESISHGRLGDAVWGQLHYDMPYQYTITDGKVVAAENLTYNINNATISSSPEHKILIKLLTAPTPVSINMLSH